MAEFPHWTDLPNEHRQTLVRITSSFGLNGDGDTVEDDGWKFPTQKTAEMWAIELYTLSSIIIQRMNGMEPK